jgi:hypothetical protein
MIINGDESTRQQDNRGPGMSVVRFRELIKYELVVDKKKKRRLRREGRLVESWNYYAVVCRSIVVVVVVVCSSVLFRAS